MFNEFTREFTIYYNLHSLAPSRALMKRFPLIPIQHNKGIGTISSLVNKNTSARDKHFMLTKVVLNVNLHNII